AEFEVDDVAEWSKAVATLASAAKDEPSMGAVLEETLPIVRQALAAQQFEAAQRLLESLTRMAQRPAGRKLLPQIAALREQSADAERLARGLQAARQKLEADPDDPDANLAVGASLCFSHGDWQGGLPHLAIGADAALQAAAGRELAGAKTPEDELAVGDAWWDAGDKAAKEYRSAAISRAAGWYRRARPGVASGLAQAKIDKRLAEAGPLAASSEPAGAKGPAGSTAGKGVLLVLHIGEEQGRVPAMCQKANLPIEVASNFDLNRTDYAKFHTLLAGSNAMDYFGQDHTRQPEAFGHIERFVAEGGHLVLFGVFDGRNCENLARFGVYTEARHAETFQSVGRATELLLQDVEPLVPKDGRMKSCGAIQCAVPHEVLLRIGLGRREGETAMISLPYKAGRVTFTECEPHAAGDWWLMEAVIGWIARGAPLPAGSP
ncbi:MAG TPA: hypothetical protein VFV87_08450, partial [Pirellulaceae bacterium]|nr:hypothetical protein [Pirellulaceae bacterium]